MSHSRIRLAESLLQEAVYCARARQAAGVGLAGSVLESLSGPGRCGLGKPIELELELTPHGKELLHELLPHPLGPTQLARIREVVARWIERADALDRKRNHFRRDFRAAHGFDRRDYGPAESQEFEKGLAQINAEANVGLRTAAEELLHES